MNLGAMDFCSTGILSLVSSFVFPGGRLRTTRFLRTNLDETTIHNPQQEIEDCKDFSSDDLVILSQAENSLSFRI